MNQEKVLQVKKSWVQVGNTFNLFVEISDGRTFYKSFKVLDVKPGCEPVVEVNKKLKEFDLIEQLKYEYGVTEVIWEQ